VDRQYTNGEITVVWKAERCAHSGICARGLGDVFSPRRRPWIELQHATSERISEQVERCPSGALTWFRNVRPPDRP
jgi:uncharacterized Fe-S cluster protein YjdI